MEVWHVIASLGASIGALFAYKALRGSPPSPHIQAARRTPRTAVADAADGSVVKIAGTARPGKDVLLAPFSKRQCCAYSAWLKRDVADHEDDISAVDARKAGGADVRGFFVEEATGRARIEVGPDTKAVGTERKVGSGFDAGARVRWEQREWALLEGDTVEVLGQARWEQDLDAGEAAQGYRDAPRVLVVTATLILAP